MRDGLTLTEALSHAGYTHRRPEGAEPGSPAAAAHDIVAHCGTVVARLKVHEAWEWLRDAPNGLCCDPVCSACEGRRQALGLPTQRQFDEAQRDFGGVE